MQKLLIAISLFIVLNNVNASEINIVVTESSEKVDYWILD